MTLNGSEVGVPVSTPDTLPTSTSSPLLTGPPSAFGAPGAM